MKENIFILYLIISLFFTSVFAILPITETDTEIIEIDTAKEKIYTIEPKKRYKFNLNTNRFLYFFKSPIDGVILF